MNKVFFSCAALLLAAQAATAGGILTNTNQSAAFLRNPARDGAIGIDGTYSNPAGVAFLEKGIHLSFNNQSAFQTRVIQSGINVAMPEGQGLTEAQWQAMPFSKPFKMFGGDANGVKEFKGEASAPIVPSIQAAINYDKWGFQASFALVGGGGKATFNRGLGSFERQISLLPAILNSVNQKAPELNLGTDLDKAAYSVESYIHGQQYIFGLQLGSTYKFNEHVAVYGGFRFNYVYNKYEGSITNINANINGTNENLHEYLGTVAAGLTQKAGVATQTAAQMRLQAATAEAEGNTALAQQLTAGAAQYEAGAQKATQGAAQMEGMRKLVADRYLDCTQTGWAIAPIVGVNVKLDKLNIGFRHEFTTHFNIQNNTKRDDTGLFTDGVNTPGDMPGITTLGLQYEVLPTLRVMAGYHYFWDKNARMDKDKQTRLTGNTMEVNFGAEYDITDDIQISAGGQRTKYGLGDGSFLNDMSFVTSSYSIGFGVGVKLSQKMKLDVGYFWTIYETFDKEYTEEYSAGGMAVQAKNTDSFTRTNKVFGVGLSLDL